MSTAEEMQKSLEKTMKEQIAQLTQTMKDYTKETVEKVLNNQTSKTSLEKMKEKLDRKRKLEDVTLSNAGNKDQYKHNMEVLTMIDEAQDHIESNDIELAKESLKNGKKVIEDRLKLIRIADREGWLTVRHFVSDDLTSTEEEEKRLKKAIRSANAARERISLKKKALEHKTTEKAPSSQNDKRKMDDVTCYNCKRAGHYIYHCPFELNRETRKVPQSSSSDRKKEKYPHEH